MPRFSGVLTLIIAFIVTGCVPVSPSTAVTPAEMPTMLVAPAATMTRIPSSTPKPQPTVTMTPTPFMIQAENQTAFDHNQRLGRGVNLGNALEAPNYEGEWGMVIDEKFFDLITGAGFQTVRVPIRWNAHALSEAPYIIDSAFFERVDWVVEQAALRNLNVIINIHHYNELMENPSAHKARFLAIWDQIATHYQDEPDSVYFELLNEPNGSFGMHDWNAFAAEALDVVRKTNPSRMVIIGPGNWNSVDSLDLLALPEDDRNIIATVHYYSPFSFTHQGAEWVDGSQPWLGTQWTGSRVQVYAVRKDFERVQRWSQIHQRPVLLGEFGAYSKADDESRHLWTATVARTAEEMGMSWAYWEFGAGFGVYDRTANRWNEPILSALIP